MTEAAKKFVWMRLHNSNLSKRKIAKLLSESELEITVGKEQLQELWII